MTSLVGRLSTALLQCEELIAQIDEGRSAALAPKLEVEQSAVEGQSLFDIANLERNVVETNGARFCCSSHGASFAHPMRSGVVPISAWSSTCRTRKSATSARLIEPNRQSLDAVRTR
jgi:hypothetical protein